MSIKEEKKSTIALLGRKVGMTQIFIGDGRLVPVTVIEAGPCWIVQKKTSEKDGYDAIQIGYGRVKEGRLSKPLLGHLKKAAAGPLKVLREIRNVSPGNYEIGQELGADLFSAGDWVNITGISKGKGFAGGVKRHGYRGGRKTHGSMFHRAPGSIGASSYPSRVVKGKKMPGRMGGETKTIKNLQVLRADKGKNLLMIRGSVPGSNNGLLMIISAAT